MKIFVVDSGLNLFGDPIDEAPQRRKASDDDKRKRRWENGFQRWSNKSFADGYTHYGSCGYGRICDFCTDADRGRPCVRALNDMCREKGLKVDYESTGYEEAFDGELQRETSWKI